MRNKTIFGLTALLCLLLLVPQRLSAKINIGLVDTPRTREIYENAPQTPEKFLRVLKEFMDDPEMDGFEFGEKILGIARENWGEPNVAGKGTFSMKQIEYAPYIRGAQKMPPPGGVYDLNKRIKPPTPYRLEEDVITLDENDNLLNLEIVCFKKDFCLAPTITREILGEPAKDFIVHSSSGNCYTHLVYYNHYCSIS